MKQMLKVMNMTCSHSIPAILLLFFTLLIIEAIWGLVTLKGAFWFYEEELHSLLPISCVGLIVLLYLHVKRFYRFANSGGLTRIRLLPISKRSFIMGELVFTYASVLLIASVPFLVWFYLFHQDLMLPEIQGNAYAYVTGLTSMNIWMPVDGFEAICLLVILAAITYVIVAFTFTGIDKDRKLSLIGWLFLGCVILTFINSLAATYAGINCYSYPMLALEALLILPLLHLHLERSLLIRRRKRI